ncbi:hypothetical protein CTI12_AA580360 [Artemisia annua]|uniref:Uncharacterized protein n=1 Tax=Artemisia annua TaxID=35608 RepID=A0A2U1KP46_ARTAN|nr:hypothetical protein CTI12_AA580360 [Artemisia annua]
MVGFEGHQNSVVNSLGSKGHGSKCAQCTASLPASEHILFASAGFSRLFKVKHEGIHSHVLAFIIDGVVFCITVGHVEVDMVEAQLNHM